MYYKFIKVKENAYVNEFHMIILYKKRVKFIYLKIYGLNILKKWKIKKSWIYNKEWVIIELLYSVDLVRRSNMDTKDIEEMISRMKSESSTEKFKPKQFESFRNNQKNFQYDYEEDFYEPRDFYNDYE